MEDKTYTLNYIRTVQVSPDDWESYPVAIELSDATTILEVNQLLASELKVTIDKVDLRGMKIGVVHKRNP